MCTGLMLTAADGSVIHGRTAEFGVPLDMSIIAVPRGRRFVGATPQGDGLEYRAKYGAVGISCFGDDGVLDGLNEAGLAAAAFFFPTVAHYTPVTDENRSRGLSPGDFCTWLVTQFATVAQARQAIVDGSVVVTPTVMPGWGDAPPPFHYVVYDKSGASVVVEPIDGRLVVHDNPLGVITNSPSFDWHMTNLRNYIALDPRNVPAIEVDGESFSQLGQGSGMLGLPGDFSPPARFVRAASLQCHRDSSRHSRGGSWSRPSTSSTTSTSPSDPSVTSPMVRCTDSTQLTAVRDPANGRYYFRTYDDQTLRAVDLAGLDLDADSIARLDTAGPRPIVDMTATCAERHRPRIRAPSLAWAARGPGPASCCRGGPGPCLVCAYPAPGPTRGAAGTHRYGPSPRVAVAPCNRCRSAPAFG